MRPFPLSVSILHWPDDDLMISINHKTPETYAYTNITHIQSLSHKTELTRSRQRCAPKYKITKQKQKYAEEI